MWSVRSHLISKITVCQVRVKIETMSSSEQKSRFNARAASVFLFPHSTLRAALSSQFDTVRDIKEKLCYISTAQGAPPGEDEYELPDGSTVALGSECRSQAAEVTEGWICWE